MHGAVPLCFPSTELDALCRPRPAARSSGSQHTHSRIPPPSTNYLRPVALPLFQICVLSGPAYLRRASIHGKAAFNRRKGTLLGLFLLEATLLLTLESKPTWVGRTKDMVVSSSHVALQANLWSNIPELPYAQVAYAGGSRLGFTSSSVHFLSALEAG